MSLPNTEKTVIAMGYNCHVRAGKDAADAAASGLIAMVASFQATEDFQVQDAICVGNLGPIDIAPQSYNCSITMDGFLPAKGVIDKQETPDGGKVAITNIIKDHTREKFMEQEITEKIPYLDFYNKKAGEGSGKVLAAFKGVILSSYGITSDANGYVRNNVQLRALEMVRADKT